MTQPFDPETAEYSFVISPSARESGEPRGPTNVHVEVAGVSHPGKVRPKNEDHFLISRINRRPEILQTNVPQDRLPEQTGDDGYLYVVADGMGGMAAGEIASRLAIITSLKLLRGSRKWAFKAKQGLKINQSEARGLFEQFSDCFQEIDRTLTEQREADARLCEMGTTITAAHSVGIDLFIIHVGNSRAYLYRTGTLQQLTKDHTVAQAMADAGYITKEAVKHHVRRNALTNFLGGQSGKVKADVRWLRLRDGDRLLLCTDGLTQMVDDASIARILGQQDTASAAAQALLDEALNQGGKDNVTVIVAGYQFPNVESVERQEIPEQKPILDSTVECGAIPDASDSANNPSEAAPHD